MKVDKRIVVTEEIDVKFTGITLLSKEEYEANKDIIPQNNWWWLRSPGPIRYDVACVDYDGTLFYSNVYDAHGCVRPALYIWNPQSSDLKRGDKFDLAGYTWTVLSDDLALCDDIVGCTCFRENWPTKDANDFDASDIKKWLHKWAEDNDIYFMMQTFSPD